MSNQRNDAMLDFILFINWNQLGKDKLILGQQYTLGTNRRSVRQFLINS